MMRDPAGSLVVQRTIQEAMSDMILGKSLYDCTSNLSGPAVAVRFTASVEISVHQLTIASWRADAPDDVELSAAMLECVRSRLPTGSLDLVDSWTGEPTALEYDVDINLDGADQPL